MLVEHKRQELDKESCSDRRDRGNTMKRCWKGNWSLPVASSKLTFAPTILIYSLPILLLLVISFNSEPLVSCGKSGKDAKGAQQQEEKWNFFEMRPRLGHFAHIEWDDKYVKIYEDYWKKVIAREPEIAKKYETGQWPRLRPFGDDCLSFLTNTQESNFVLKKPFDIILLDACLDWLYPRDDNAKEQREKDFANTNRKSLWKDLSELEEDKVFKAIHSETAFKNQSVPLGVMDVIQKYLVRLMDVQVLHPGAGCHSLWLEAYDDFLQYDYFDSCTDLVDCEKFLDWENAAYDSYVKMIFESTKAASERCYNVLTTSLTKYLEDEYEASDSIKSALTRFFTDNTTPAVNRQLKREKWTREMMLILQIAQNTDSNTVVDLGTVSNRLLKIKQEDEEYMRGFVGALSLYTSREAKSRGKEDASDLYGHDRYAHAMIKLCHPFVDKGSFMGKLLKDESALIEERHAFEFYHIVNSLVRLTNFEPVISKTKDGLERDIINNNWAALYLATFTCQLVSTTWVEKTDDTNKEEFDVTLKRNWQAYISAWPIEYVAEKLINWSSQAGESEDALYAPDSPERPKSPPRRPKSPKHTKSPKSPARPNSPKKEPIVEPYELDEADEIERMPSCFGTPINISGRRVFHKFRKIFNKAPAATAAPTPSPPTADE